MLAGRGCVLLGKVPGGSDTHSLSIPPHLARSLLLTLTFCLAHIPSSVGSVDKPEVWRGPLFRSVRKENVFFSRSHVVELLSHVQPFATLWTVAGQAALTSTISQNLLRFMLIELVIPSNYLILCCSLLLLPSVFPSIRVFSNESPLCIRWPKYWSLSISPSSEESGLISCQIDWFDQEPHKW